MRGGSLRARLGGVLTLVLAAGCGHSSSAFESVQDPAQWEALVGTAWNQIREAPYTTAFQGERRVDFRVPGPDGVTVGVAYRELVSNNGQGGFTIQPLSAETPVFPDEETFLLLQERRQGFFHRYRDFQVRDTDLLLENFQLVGGIHSVTIAGRSCMEAQLVRRSAGGHHYRVAFDIATGLPLRYVEYDDEAKPVASMVFESIDFAPDLHGVDYFVPTNAEVPFDLQGGVAESILGFTPRIPAFVPEGFELIETAKVEDHLGRRWVKLGYTDGVEMLFFLHRSVDHGSQLAYPATARTHTTSEPQGEIMVFEAGPVVVAQGVVGRDEFIAVGEVAEARLLHMIDSALD